MVEQIVRARGVVTDGAGAFVIDELDVGPPGPNEVLVSIAASGICHTDHDIALSSPSGIVLGHEGAGTVTAVGEGVDDLQAGARVLLTWAISCRSCFQCSLGNEVLCETLGAGPGGHAHPDATTRNGEPLTRAFNLGTLSSATIVRREAVVPIGDSIPFTSACLLGCGVMTGFGSVMNAARVPAGASVVVIGCGGVGLNVIQGARIAGASVILAFDVNDDRLSMAKAFGATDILRAARDDEGLRAAADAARAVVGARGADFAFECTGVPSLCAAPLAFVRNGGTAIQVSGTEQEVTIDMRLFEWDKVYLNPLYGKCRPSVDFPRLLDLYEKGDLLLDELVTKAYGPDDVASAFGDMVEGSIAKGVVVFES